MTENKNARPTAATVGQASGNAASNFQTHFTVSGNGNQSAIVQIKMIGNRNMQTGIARTPIRHTAIDKITLLSTFMSCFLNDAMFGVLLHYSITKIDLLLFLSSTDNCIVAITYTLPEKR